jgi:hypothetical protein
MVIHMLKKISTLVNRKQPQSILTPASVALDIIKKIDTDQIVSENFTETKELCSTAEKNVPSGGCPSCYINSKYPSILSLFVSEFKSLPDDRKSVVSKYIGGREWISHGALKSWINLFTNVVEQQVYEQREIDIPDIPPKKDKLPTVDKSTEPALIENKVVEPEEKKVIETRSSDLVPHPPSIEERRKAALEKFRKQREKAVPSVDTPKKVVESTSIVSSSGSDKRKVIFKNFQAPGDIVMMTAAIRDLHLNHPGKFITDVRTNSMGIWESNPYITKLDEKEPGVEVYSAEYPLINQSNQGPYHFSEGFTDHFETLLGVRIRNRLCRGHIVIGSNEDGWGWTERNTWFSQFGYAADVHYWILNAGFKNDFTAKMWPVERYQKVIDHFAGRVVFVQMGHKSHNHPELNGTINLVGKTDDRQLIRLVWASSGVLTPCSYPMTLAAAVPVKQGTCNGRRDRPCVVIAGGREPSHWQAYTSHQFIHTCGSLPCCDNGGCWKSRIKPIGDNDEKDRKNMCEYVVNSVEGVELPFCMDMITADEVIRRIEMYYRFYEPGRPKTHTHNKE